jgi:hypothetical protein
VDFFSKIKTNGAFVFLIPIGSFIALFFLLYFLVWMGIFGPVIVTDEKEEKSRNIFRRLGRRLGISAN